MDEHTLVNILYKIAAFSPLIVVFIWILIIYVLTKKEPKQTPPPEEKTQDQDTDNYTCFLADEGGTNALIAVVEKSCLDCQHCFIHENKQVACYYFKNAAPLNAEMASMPCNMARRLYKLCGREAKHFQPKEIKGTSENE